MRIRTDAHHVAQRSATGRVQRKTHIYSRDLRGRPDRTFGPGAAWSVTLSTWIGLPSADVCCRATAIRCGWFLRRMA